MPNNYEILLFPAFSTLLRVVNRNTCNTGELHGEAAAAATATTLAIGKASIASWGI
jgi:hypothetical protein